jgi:NAD-dependent SIR2 family protein deacetylase
MAKYARCFRCKKKFPIKKDQHPKFSLCPACKSFKEEFGSGSSWIDHSFRGPGKRA